MKKLIIVIIVCGLVFTSCTTVRQMNVIQEPERTDIVFKQTGYVTTWYPIYLMLEWNSVKGVEILISNKSENTITIIWEKSSITYNKETHSIFISGQKYIEAGRSADNITIPPQGNILKEIYPSDSIVLSKDIEWKVKSMGIGKTDEVTLNICVLVNGEELYLVGKSKPKQSGFGIWFY